MMSLIDPTKEQGGKIPLPDPGLVRPGEMYNFGITGITQNPLVPTGTDRNLHF